MKRSTVIMLVLLALAAGLYWYMNQPDNLVKKALDQQNTPTPTVEDLGSLVGPERPAVMLLSLENADGRELMLTNVNSVWMVTDGYTDIANQESAGSAADGVRYMNIMKKIGANLTDLQPYGLDKPTWQISIGFSDKSTLQFKVGSATPTGLGYYVLLEDNSVVVVNKYGVEGLTGLMDTPLFMFTATPSPTPSAIPTETATPLPPSQTPVPSETPAVTATP